jgi:(2Fe-2S) ferredoxin
VSQPRRHFFVCTNARPEGGKPSCGARGRAVCEALELGLAQNPSAWDEVAVTPTGCLGPCFDGPTVVVYPEGVWYAHVEPPDARELVDEHLVGGRAVERLRYRWPSAE